MAREAAIAWPATLSEDLPVVSAAVDTRERIDAVLGVVEDLHGDGLVTLERARLLSARSRASAAWSPARWCRRSPPSTARGAGGALRLADHRF